MASCPECGNDIPVGQDGCPLCATQAFNAGHNSILISGYEILGRLGEGGMGTIYLAEEKSLGRRVAIKVISGNLASEPQTRARFMREARALATVEHPNVVRVYSFGEVEGHPYLAMEYVDGETLAGYIRRFGTLSPDEAIRILRQILLALEAAWEKGIVHRDVKPSNVLIDRRGQVHVVDFGLAKTAQGVTDGALTQEGSVVGTPYYLAPEQAQGEPADFRADVYSCGILLYEMLAGERPFEGTTPLAIVAQHIHTPLPSIRGKRKDVPNRVVRLVERMTEKKPSLRAASYAELLSAVDALLGITPTRPITPTETFSTLRIESPRRFTLPLAATAALVLIIAAFAFRGRLLNRTNAAPPRESRFVVAVAPFYGPDSDSEREGRLMAALIERSIQSRLEDNVRVIGIEETKTPVRHNDAARKLGESVHAGVVVWGEAFALRTETEIQPHFTIIRNQDAAPEPRQSGNDVARINLRTADPSAQLESQRPNAMRLEAEAPNQIALRKTSAEGVGEMVSLLAAVHALYTENAPRKALAFLDQAPRSADALRYRAEAHLQLREPEKAAAVLEDVLELEPQDAASHARRADLHMAGGSFDRAVPHYEAAASSGRPYKTQLGIVYDGLLYRRETYRSATLGTGGDDDTGYLLAVDPRSGTVINRYRIPGMIRSFTPNADGFTMAYVVRDRRDARIHSLSFSSGEFDQPLTYLGGNLLLRMRGAKSGWVLAQNFTDEFMGVMHKQPPKPTFRLKKEPSDEAPATLPDLEAALRAAIRHDPTQPWHLFFLGQTLAAQGRAEEAAAWWNELLSRDFAVPYLDWAWMARHFERLGQREWADRAWERGVRERGKIPQPIQFTTLIERLINAPVTRLHEAQLADPDRAHEWLVRTRGLTGMTEGDHIAAAAWTRHFRAAGDPREKSEREVLRIARSHPFNFIAHAARIDYALYVWTATWFGLFASLILLRGDGAARERRLDEIPWPRRVLSSFGAAPRPWRPLIFALAVSAALYVAVLIRIEATAAPSFTRGTMWMPWFAGTALLLVTVWLMLRVFRIREIAAALSPVRQISLFATFLICLVATFALFRLTNHQIKLASMNIGAADSIGHPEIIAEFEERLSKHPARELRYTAAVANDYAGRTERAKTHYRELPDDLRARRALADLEKGTSSPEMPSTDELYRAYTAGAPWWFMMSASPLGAPEALNKLFNFLAWTILGFCAALLVIRLFIPDAAGARTLRQPTAKWRKKLRRAGLLLIPGAYDVRYRSLPLGTLLLTLTGFTIWLAISCWKGYRVPGAIGISSAIAMPNYSLAFPLPLDTSTIGHYLAAPHAMLFLSVAVIAVIALVCLHALRLEAILRLDREEAVATNAPTLVQSLTQPAE